MDRASVFLQSLVDSAGAPPPEVFPGDNVTEMVTKNPVLGQGLRVDASGCVFVTLAGVLKVRPSTRSSYVEPCSRLPTYSPRQGDQVIGIIDNRGGDWYTVNVFSGSNVLLSRLGFEGASKRNKPELDRGDVVYARVAQAAKDLDVELTCISSSGIRKDWSSGAAIYGPLAEGVLVRISVQLARAMLLPDCVLLNALGKHLAFEVTIGFNGLVWIKAGNPLDTIIVRNAITNAELIDDSHTEAMVEQLVRKSKPK